MTHPHERRDGLDVKSITDGLDDIKDTHFGLIGCGVGKSPHFGHITVVNTPPAKSRWLQVTAQSRIGPPFGGLK